MKKARCAICKCEAVAIKYGFAVCEYHIFNSEDAPDCPNCVKESTKEKK